MAAQVRPYVHQCRIQKVRGAQGMCSQSQSSFFIFMQFSGKIWPNKMLDPTPFRVGDISEESGIHHGPGYISAGTCPPLSVQFVQLRALFLGGGGVDNM